MDEFTVCKECFYRYRSRGEFVQCSHNHHRERIHVCINDNEDRLETTERSIRPLPEHFPEDLSSVAMCDPHRGTCRKDNCTFAHGREEQTRWNREIRNRRRAGAGGEREGGLEKEEG